MERRLEMKTANNRQQYPGFACFPSDNNFNLPTHYIHCYNTTMRTYMSVGTNVNWELAIKNTVGRKYCIVFAQIMAKLTR